MDRKTTQDIWILLEEDLQIMEQAQRIEPHLVRHVQAAVGMLLDCEPSEVLRCIEESSLPTRALVSWLAFEGHNLGLGQGVAALTKEWMIYSGNQNNLIAPPRAA